MKIVAIVATVCVLALTISASDVRIPFEFDGNVAVNAQAGCQIDDEAEHTLIFCNGTQAMSSEFAHEDGNCDGTPLSSEPENDYECLTKAELIDRVKDMESVAVQVFFNGNDCRSSQVASMTATVADTCYLGSMVECGSMYVEKEWSGATCNGTADETTEYALGCTNQGGFSAFHMCDVTDLAEMLWDVGTDSFRLSASAALPAVGALVAAVAAALLG